MARRFHAGGDLRARPGRQHHLLGQRDHDHLLPEQRQHHDGASDVARAAQVLSGGPRPESAAESGMRAEAVKAAPLPH